MATVVYLALSYPKTFQAERLAGIVYPDANVGRVCLRLDMQINFIVFNHRMWSQRGSTQHSLSSL